MIILYGLIIVGISFSAVGFFILKGRDENNERLGCVLSIIGIACFIIGILGLIAIPIVDMIRGTVSP